MFYDNYVAIMDAPLLPSYSTKFIKPTDSFTVFNHLNICDNRYNRFLLDYLEVLIIL